MRSIEISTSVFAKIWALRTSGEDDENAILARILGVSEARQVIRTSGSATEKIRWRDDVRAALVELDGPAPLATIYGKVREIRVAAGRSLPINTPSIIRRELETNSADTRSFTGKNDWFHSVGGIGSGSWALREWEAGR